MRASSSPFASDNVIAGFRRDGWTLIRGAATRAQIERHAPALTRATSERCVPGDGAAFLPVSNLWRIDADCAAFVGEPAFAAIACALLGCERVRLYHDQAMFSEPGAAATPWHQDAQHWAVPGDRCLTMWMPLVDLDEAMGTLTYVSDSRREGLLGDWPISDASQRFFAGRIAERRWSSTNAGAMAAGDALFHDGWVVHGAPPNATPRMRAVMTVLYVADGTHLLEPAHPDQARALAQWTPGWLPGQPVESPLNPRLG